MPKILYFDIETAPLKSYHWNMWKQNIPKKMNLEEWFIMSVAWKWLDQKRVYCETIHDHGLTAPYGRECDYGLLEKLGELFNEADIVVAHNGDKFDIRKVQARMIYHDIAPPSPFATVDTYKVAKKHFAFTTNRLDDLGEYLGLGRKVDTGGFELWRDCLEGKPAAWKLMKKYNKQDIVLGESVYLKLRPWMSNHPNVSIFTEVNVPSCTCCGSTDLSKWGFFRTNAGKYQRYVCNNCGSWVRGAKSQLNPATKEVATRSAGRK